MWKGTNGRKELKGTKSKSWGLYNKLHVDPLINVNNNKLIVTYYIIIVIKMIFISDPNHFGLLMLHKI
jgi:hypothetical protein